MQIFYSICLNEYIYIKYVYINDGHGNGNRNRDEGKKDNEEEEEEEAVVAEADVKNYRIGSDQKKANISKCKTKTGSHS